MKKKQKAPAFLKNKNFRHKQLKQQKNAADYLGLGPKFVNSIVIGLNEDDDIHEKKLSKG